jgi:Pyruvate/2-oxoacid:ferredoxin oxidoreductase delta subunit
MIYGDCPLLQIYHPENTKQQLRQSHKIDRSNVNHYLYRYLCLDCQFFCPKQLYYYHTYIIIFKKCADVPTIILSRLLLGQIII